MAKREAIRAIAEWKRTATPEELAQMQKSLNAHKLSVTMIARHLDKLNSKGGT